jgi:CRISPR-associated protein Csx3
VQVHRLSRANYTQLTFTLPTAYLDYSEAQEVAVPLVPPEQGLILSGKLPLWLWTALAITYRYTLWLAIYQPQLGNQAVVVYSRVSEMVPGRPVPASDELEM